jgi:hypothetical protein
VEIELQQQSTRHSRVKDRTEKVLKRAQTDRYENKTEFRQSTRHKETDREADRQSTRQDRALDKCILPEARRTVPQ